MFEIVIVCVVLWFIFGKRAKEAIQPTLDKTDVDEKIAAFFSGGENGEFANRLAKIRFALTTLRDATNCDECLAKIDEVEQTVTVEAMKK